LSYLSRQRKRADLAKKGRWAAESSPRPVASWPRFPVA
jgi:hypothetical protein